ncbi:MAG: GNAT family N-acetyltransferase [bacterium]|nr:GNAT family N-acetyltransferase [bacterium]
MNALPGFVIRDGLESDIPACLELNANYETDYVWQVTFQQGTGLRTASFKTEHLPRTMSVTYPPSEHRLRQALEGNECLLVAAGRDDPDLIVGYLVMQRDPMHGIAHVHDLVVSQPLRRRKIGSRLLKVARQWAVENGMTRLMVETQTKNYPAIQFCQNSGLVFCGFNDRYFDNQDIAVFFAQNLR